MTSTLYTKVHSPTFEHRTLEEGSLRALFFKIITRQAMQALVDEKRICCPLYPQPLLERALRYRELLGALSLTPKDN
jgi:hypothetical protein